MLPSLDTYSPVASRWALEQLVQTFLSRHDMMLVPMLIHCRWWQYLGSVWSCCHYTARHGGGGGGDFPHPSLVMITWCRDHLMLHRHIPSGRWRTQLPASPSSSLPTVSNLSHLPMVGHQFAKQYYPLAFRRIKKKSRRHSLNNL